MRPEVAGDDILVWKTLASMPIVRPNCMAEALTASDGRMVRRHLATIAKSVLPKNEYINPKECLEIQCQTVVIIASVEVDSGDEVKFPP